MLAKGADFTGTSTAERIVIGDVDDDDDADVDGSDDGGSRLTATGADALAVDSTESTSVPRSS